jgi:glycosyltransferase involved in cell wall biosynthesis
VLFLGLLHRQKGAHDLVQAFAKLPESATQLRLVLAGVGDVDELRTLARRQGVGDRVDFPGWVGPEEKARWLHRAACLVLPSYAEGLPIAALEAMAFAVPVIAS